MPEAIYDITSTVLQTPSLFIPGEPQYEATGNVLDAITNTGWEENLGFNEGLLRVTPTTPFNLQSIGRLSFVPPDLNGLPPGRVRLDISFDLYCEGLIRDNIAVPWDIAYYLHYSVYSDNTFGGIEDYTVNGGFYSLVSIGTSGLVSEIENFGYSPITNPQDPYQSVVRETAPYNAPGTTLDGVNFSYSGTAYYSGINGTLDPEQLFINKDHQYINVLFSLTTGKQNEVLPPLEFGWRVSNLTVKLVVEDAASTGDILPITGECGVVESTYVVAPPEINGWIFPQTNEEWTIDWFETHTDDEIRWEMVFTALEDLTFGSLTVFAGSFSNDGGIGNGATNPSQGTDSIVLSPTLSDVSGVLLDPLASIPQAAGVSVIGTGTFPAGATFKLSFSHPKEFPVYLAAALPGVEVLPEIALGPFLEPNQDNIAFSMAWTGVCTPQDEFFITWWEPGSKTYERGVDRGVLYMDDGRVVPWNGLTEVSEDLGRSAESVYFDGVKLAEIVNPDGVSAQVSAISYPRQLEEVYGNLPLRRGIYLGGQPPKTFGFSYRTKLGTELNEDAGYKIHIIYNILAIPDSRSYRTISDDLDLTEFGWTFKTTPESLTTYRPSAYLVLDSTKITPSLLAELETILYGTTETQPRLPSLEELLDIINGFNNFINIIDNGDGSWEANTLADGVINDLGNDVYEIQHANIQWTSANSYLISPTPDPP